MYNQELMKAKLEDSGVTLTFIAKKTGMKYETLRRKLQGTHPWNLDEAKAVARVLKFSDSEIIKVFFA